MASATFCSKSTGEWGCWRRDPKTQWINGEGVLWVIQKVPDLWWFHLRWFECMMLRKQSAFGRKYAWDVELRHFLGLGTWGTIFSRDVGQRAAASSSLIRLNNPHNGDHSAPTQPLRVPFRIQCIAWDHPHVSIKESLCQMTLPNGSYHECWEQGSGRLWCLGGFEF